jgi:Mn2+/Fe2+ NRAMP family transporter
LEKGYAKFVGKNDGSAEWNARAAGWMRVMRVDAWGAMAVYTFATIAFYLLGAAILHRVGLNPEKDNLVRTLAVMFVPVFSNWAAGIFLFGAFAVLYSTFFVANASHARTFSDALRVIGVIEEDEVTRAIWIRRLSGGFPILCLVIYLVFPSPAQLVLLSGVAQGIMLPMLAGAALYFRYQRCPPALMPGKAWDVMLWLSAAAMLVTGAWTAWVQF